MTDVDRLFRETIALCNSTAYVEEESQLHTEITGKMWERLKEVSGIEPPAKILDIGCGSGVALKLFKADGFDPVGMTCCTKEIEALGTDYQILPWDAHAVACFDSFFDVVWIRHTIEHSFAPFLLLRAIRRALKNNGWMYIETPQPDGPCNHEGNPNHWSVLGKTAWEHLITRAGFEIVKADIIEINVVPGVDRYFGWICKTR